MRAVDIIQKKRDNGVLIKEEIEFLLNGYLKEEIPDYQISSFLMAVYFRGMSEEEVSNFTEIMKNSGDTIKLEGVEKFIVDKHSTGGVGDKTTIAIAPIFAALGIATAKLSGKGLGHTGGTIDKFESIPGFIFSKTAEEMVNLINKTGTGIMGYSDKIVPLDKKLYSLRDVTATVPSIPLIASSVMSKKLAVRSDAIILDVKVGSGAFMKSEEEARDLAKVMSVIGKNSGRKIKVILTNMDEPLGKNVGNSLEIIEAVEMLKGRGPDDFALLVKSICAIGLQLKGEVDTIEEGIKRVEEVIASGAALQALKAFIHECGGDEGVVDDYSKLGTASYKKEVIADNEGYICSINAEKIGTTAMILGAGRASKNDIIDHTAGVICNKKVGDYVKKGETLAELYFSDKDKAESAEKILRSAVSYSDERVEKRRMIIDVI